MLFHIPFQQRTGDPLGPFLAAWHTEERAISSGRQLIRERRLPALGAAFYFKACSIFLHVSLERLADGEKR